MMGFRKKAGRLVLTLLIAGESGAALAQVLILRSVGPSARTYPAGQRLPDDATLVLRAGDSVTVLRRGGTRIFRGPGRPRVDAPVSISTSLTASRGVRASAGAVRGLQYIAPRPPDVWLIDATSTQTACFRTGTPVTLWRAAFDRPGSLTVISSTASTRVEWPAGQQTLRLSSAVQAGDGTVIEAVRPGAQRPVRITLAAIDVDPADREAVALGLLGRNCRDQIDTFAALNDEEAAAAAD